MLLSQCVCTTEPSWLMHFREVISAYSWNHTKQVECNVETIQASQYATAASSGRESTFKQHEVVLCSISHDRALTGSNVYSSIQETCISSDEANAIRKSAQY
jgi:hypothetical protein